MTPFKANGRGSFILDRRFRHVGRIKRASGTAHLPTFRRIDEMLSGLFERGRLDLLKSIQDGTLTPLQVYDAYRLNELEKLPTLAAMAPLKETMQKWIDGYDCSDKHRISLNQSLRYFVNLKPKATVGDLPALLTVLRGKMQGKANRTFNVTRSAAQAFVRSTLKKNHPLWLEITSIEVLKVKVSVKRHPLTPTELNELTEKMPLRHSIQAREMAHTGMGPAEYWGEWKVAAIGTRIFGTKRKGRDRTVPTLIPLRGPTTEYQAFRKAIAKASDNRVTPYDLRRSYANWLESAGIPRTRRKLYLGHGAGDVTDLYERHEVEAFLREDREKLLRFVGATEKPSLKLEKGS